MKVIILFALLGACYAQNLKYVFDVMRIFDANEVATMLASAQPGKDYPNYNDIPASAQAYKCDGKQGFYADSSTQCQVFHRCDINGNHTAYICVNTTVFNQVTLVCDYYFNVDCSKSKSYETFANSRLYTDQPLFDTPPADYVVPAMAAIQKKQAASIGGRSIDSDNKANQVSPNKGPNKPAPGKATPATTAAPTEAPAEETTPTAAEPTTAAAGEETTPAVAGGEETTTAAGGETTPAAGGDETTPAAGGETSPAAGGEDTTVPAAAGGDETTAAGEDTTTGGDETTAASEETTTAAAAA